MGRLGGREELRGVTFEGAGKDEQEFAQEREGNRKEAESQREVSEESPPRVSRRVHASPDSSLGLLPHQAPI